MKKLVDGVKLMLNKITPKRRRDSIFGNTQKRGNFGGGGGPRGSYGGRRGSGGYRGGGNGRTHSLV